MKILKILGVVIIILIVGYLLGFLTFYRPTNIPTMLRPEPGTEYISRNCIGKSITIYNNTPVDGDLLYFCIGTVKTETRIAR